MTKESVASAGGEDFFRVDSKRCAFFVIFFTTFLLWRFEGHHKILISFSISAGSLLTSMITCQDSRSFHFKSTVIFSFACINSSRSSVIASSEIKTVTSRSRIMFGCATLASRATQLVVFLLTKLGSSFLVENNSLNVWSCVRGKRSLLYRKEIHSYENVIHLFDRVLDKLLSVASLVRLVYLFRHDSHPGLLVFNHEVTILSLLNRLVLIRR